MKCNQTGRTLIVSIESLSKENGDDLHSGDLTPENTVIFEGKNRKSYNVTIQGSSSGSGMLIKVHAWSIILFPGCAGILITFNNKTSIFDGAIVAYYFLSFKLILSWWCMAAEFYL